MANYITMTDLQYVNTKFHYNWISALKKQTKKLKKNAV